MNRLEKAVEIFNRLNNPEPCQRMTKKEKEMYLKAQKIIHSSGVNIVYQVTCEHKLCGEGRTPYHACEDARLDKDDGSINLRDVRFYIRLA